MVLSIRAEYKHTLRSSKSTLGWKYKPVSPKGKCRVLRAASFIMSSNWKQLGYPSVVVSIKCATVIKQALAGNINMKELLPPATFTVIRSNTGRSVRFAS